MINLYEIILFVAGVVLPIILGLSFFVERHRSYPVWVKVAASGICIAALSWWSLHLVLLNSSKLHLSRQIYYRLVGLDGIFVGLALGFLVCIQIAGYNKPRRTSDHKQE